MGERGRLQTNQLSRKVPPVAPVEVVLQEPPRPIVLEAPFVVTLEVTNSGSQTARFSLSWIKAKLGPLYPIGPTVTPLSDLAPHASTTVQLTVRAWRAESVPGTTTAFEADTT